MKRNVINTFEYSSESLDIFLTHEEFSFHFYVISIAYSVHTRCHVIYLNVNNT